MSTEGKEGPGFSFWKTGRMADITVSLSLNKYWADDVQTNVSLQDFLLFSIYIDSDKLFPLFFLMSFLMCYNSNRKKVKNDLCFHQSGGSPAVDQRWKELDIGVHEVQRQTNVRSLIAALHACMLVSHPGALLFLSVSTWTLMQEVKREIKSLEVLYENHDFILKAWQNKGVVGDVKRQMMMMMMV